jgi:hypothetical protein
MNKPAPIVGTVQVWEVGPTGVHASVNGDPRRFSDLRALFAAAVRLLGDECDGHRPGVQLELIPH